MTPLAYQYVVLRCVPRVDREEFVNVGVVLYCQAGGVLDMRSRVSSDRLRSLHPDLDVDAVLDALEAVRLVCEGATGDGRPDLGSPGQRFGWLAAPRSTVVQPSPVHSGISSDPVSTLDALLDRYV